MSKRAYIFDVDGTLTPSRQKMNPEFSEWFTDWVKQEYVFLVTGSDYPKTVEQLGEEICNTVQRCYNCSGNSVWEQGDEIYGDELKLENKVHDFLTGKLVASEFPLRTGMHFENRPGMINFSVVGRNANLNERADYVRWDVKTNERHTIAEEFNELFPEYQAVVGGETGLDISKLGCDKSQIIWDFDDYDISFFGDKMEPGGNDHTLAEAVKSRFNEQDVLHHVTSWTDTWIKISHAQ